MKDPLEALQSLGNSIVQETLDDAIRRLHALGFADICLIGTVLTPDSNLSTVMCRSVGQKLSDVATQQHEACLQIFLADQGGEDTGHVGPTLTLVPGALN